MSPNQSESTTRPRVRRETVLGAADLAAFGVCAVAALHLRFGRTIPWEHQLGYLSLWPLLFAWQWFMAYTFRLYDFRHRLTLTEHLFGGAGAAVSGAGGSYLFIAFMQLYTLPLSRVSRIVTLLQILLLLAWYLGSRAAMLAWLQRQGWRVRVALVGQSKACGALADEISTHAPPLLEVCGSVRPRALDALTRLRPDQVVLAGLDLPQPALRDLLVRCDHARAELFLYPGLNLTALVSSRVASIAGVPVVALGPAGGTGPYAVCKPLIDRAAALAFLVLTLPLALAAAAVIKFSSPGPVLFTQERVGLHGRTFRLLKFRTMVVGAEDATGVTLAQAEDPRITPAGRVLRRTRIDELPQLWNVLRGEMSLVGPRPERKTFVDAFAGENPLYERRHLVRPGVTGLAQVHGRYDTDYTHKLRYDLVYINTVSLATDLRILYATIQTVLTGRGAR